MNSCGTICNRNSLITGGLGETQSISMHLQRPRQEKAQRRNQKRPFEMTFACRSHSRFAQSSLATDPAARAVATNSHHVYLRLSVTNASHDRPQLSSPIPSSFSLWEHRWQRNPISCLDLFSISAQEFGLRARLHKNPANRDSRKPLLSWNDRSFSSTRNGQLLVHTYSDHFHRRLHGKFWEFVAAYSRWHKASEDLTKSGSRGIARVRLLYLREKLQPPMIYHSSFQIWVSSGVIPWEYFRFWSGTRRAGALLLTFRICFCEWISWNAPQSLYYCNVLLFDTNVVG
ncbi:hypothetical protein BKA70DRAFT_1383860 [Coprinopsis sp. MPI-PUGE-AT-0042]|nr:hypothetical protein BKA70DRAFT_1383860 [Coprinopsis sp. MPI-PUGE-AT-0042]